PITRDLMSATILIVLFTCGQCNLLNLRKGRRQHPVFLSIFLFFLASPAALATEGGTTPVDEALRKMVVPPGFQVKLVACEPDRVQPVAQCYDERGRLWVLECLEYPNGAKVGTEPGDRIKILEDADGDGRAEKIKLFFKGLNLATGIAVGHGGVFV